ncbi:unnamed protein product, partial [Didymodactylos carnosus]
YHKPTAEPYVVPFISDQPQHVFVNVIHNHLRHAYLSSFIENEFRKFFHERISSTSLLPFIDNEKEFFLWVTNY